MTATGSAHQNAARVKATDLRAAQRATARIGTAANGSVRDQTDIAVPVGLEVVIGPETSLSLQDIINTTLSMLGRFGFAIGAVERDLITTGRCRRTRARGLATACSPNTYTARFAYDRPASKESHVRFG